MGTPTFQSAFGLLRKLFFLSNTDQIVEAVTLVDTDGNAIGPPAFGGAYETVAASQTAQVLGGVGAIGDYIQGVLVIPATTSPGAVTLLDNATSIIIFQGGASSVADLTPFFINLGMLSASGALKLTTGANVSAIAFGKFSA